LFGEPLWIFVEVPVYLPLVSLLSSFMFMSDRLLVDEVVELSNEMLLALRMAGLAPLAWW
jgi:hypothetical protein